MHIHSFSLSGDPGRDAEEPGRQREEGAQTLLLSALRVMKGS